MKRWLRKILPRHRSKATPHADLRTFLKALSGRGFEVRCAVDVGANRGGWSKALKRAFPDCTVLMIEPQMEMKEELDRFCAQHSHSRWIQAGCGDQAGELPFWVCPDTVSSSFAVESMPGWERRVIPVRTLDDLVENELRQVPDIVKVDAEGFESQILAGAAGIIGKTEMFLLEAHFFGACPHPSGIIELTAVMSDLGYAPYDYTWFGRRPYDGAVGLCEVAFARKNGILRAYHGWSEAA